MLSSDDSHFSNGRFDPDRMLDLLAGAVEQAVGDGYSFLWATGDRILEDTVNRAAQLDAEGDYMAHLYAKPPDPGSQDWKIPAGTAEHADINVRYSFHVRMHSYRLS